MFTLAQLKEIHDQFGRANTLHLYLEKMNQAGVSYYDSFVADGHSEYVSADGTSLESPGFYQELTVADSFDAGLFGKCMKRVQDGGMEYLEMMKALAESGVEKWRFNTSAFTLTYLAGTGESVSTETIS